MIMLGIFCFFYAMTLASSPTAIKIGLESVYKDAASIILSSQRNIAVGYFEDNFFRTEGRLSANSIVIKKAAEDFYFVGNAYRTLQAAQEAAAAYGSGAAAAYLEPGMYCVYTAFYNDRLVKVPSSLTRIAVYNSSGELIFVSENKDMPLVFQGSENNLSFPVTQVGNSRKYRGAIGVVNGQSGGLTAVNSVDIEEYLYGVVPVEMAPSWPIEALKAQAVAARSIAIFQHNRYLNRGYNLVDTTASQVYRGYSAESPNSNLAVDETRGEVIKYNNKVAEALYFSTSGGATEDAKYVWGNEIPYLKNVADTFETEPAQKPWVRTVTLSDISSCLVKQGINIGRVQGVELTSRTPSGRVQVMTVIGSSGSHVVKNENVRTFLSGTQEGSLKSRLFSFQGFIGTPDGGNSREVITIMSADNIIQKDLSSVKVMSDAGLQSLSPNPSALSSNRQQELKGETGTSNNKVLQSEIVFGDLTIYGQGFGHGVGMSQSGARGMAKAGYNYRDILMHYYNGITIER